MTPRTTSDTTPTGGPLPRLLNVSVLAEHLGVQDRHIRRLVHERRIPFVKWGHLLRFDPDEVRAWLETARIPVTPAQTR